YIFNRESQYIFIFDGIGDHVFVQAVFKKVFGSASAQFIFIGIIGKNRRTCESEELRIFKKLLDAVVGFTKLASVTLIKNEDDPLVPEFRHFLLILQFADGGV